MAKIYVATSWRNGFQPSVVERLRELGHEVYDFRNPPKGMGFSWSEIDPAWEDWKFEAYKEALKTPRAVEGFNSDKDGLDWSDLTVLVLPCGRSAHLEAGYAAGQGKPVFVYFAGNLKQEPELMYGLCEGGIFNSLSSLTQAIEEAKL